MLNNLAANPNNVNTSTRRSSMRKISRAASIRQRLKSSASPAKPGFIGKMGVVAVDNTIILEVKVNKL